MTRFLSVVLFVSLTLAAFGQQQQPEQEPPEEDVALQPKQQYVLNPLQAEKEIRIGNFYFKKGSYKAAVRRFEEAVKWDPNSADGWYRLGESQAKLGDDKAAREAWAKYLDLQPDGKYSAALRKRLTPKP